MLYLHHDRLRPKNVNLEPDRYAQLKGAFMTRMEEMVSYVQEEDVCRSSYLLEYFGQKDSADCGMPLRYARISKDADCILQS